MCRPIIASCKCILQAPLPASSSARGGAGGSSGTVQEIEAEMELLLQVSVVIF